MLSRSHVASAALRSALGRRYMHSALSKWATLDIDKWDGKNPFKQSNLVDGKWVGTAKYDTIPDPLNGEGFLQVPATSDAEAQAFVSSLAKVPKTGLHNPFRNVDRYVTLGRLSARMAERLRDPVIHDYFTRMIIRTSPKSYEQAAGEVTISRQFFENFSGDNVRYLARSFGVPGDHNGQQSNGYRFPYGPVALITPFNFPLEIPALQIMGALYMGNKPVVKVDSKVSVVTEQFLRLLHDLGLPKTDVDLLNCDGPTANRFLLAANPRMTLFTGSSRVAEKLAGDLKGKIKIEDAGFDWKVLGPDVSNVEYVAWQADQDAYACSGQKCSAQSIMFVHENWAKTDLYARMASLAGRRKLEDLTVGPVITWTTEALLGHVKALLAIPGARLLFGGKPLLGGKHTIPKVYGAIEPTAVFVPIDQMLKPEHYKVATTEVFGPLQVVTEYKQAQLPMVLQALEAMDAHLTAAVVSNDALFCQEVLAHTVNGTTYAGIRARTTGAPQNHWFGPSGDPRGAGIGTREAIQLVWSGHREVIQDVGPIAANWTTPKPT